MLVLIRKSDSRQKNEKAALGVYTRFNFSFLTLMYMTVYLILSNVNFRQVVVFSLTSKLLLTANQSIFHIIIGTSVSFNRNWTLRDTHGNCIHWWFRVVDVTLCTLIPQIRFKKIEIAQCTQWIILFFTQTIKNMDKDNTILIYTVVFSSSYSSFLTLFEIFLFFNFVMTLTYRL